MNNTNDLEQIDIKRMIEIVLDRIVSIVVITLVFGLISFALSKYFITPKYESSITMYINNRRSTTSIDQENVETKTLSSDITASQQLVPTYIEMLKSNNVLQTVSDTVEKTTGEVYTVNKLKGMIEAEAVSNTEIIRVSVRVVDAAIAREIANTIADVAPEKIQNFIERSDVRIIDRAKISTSPVTPNVRNNTILGALLGLVLSISFILLRELFDVRVKAADDLVMKFQYPVLGSIPEIYVSYDDNVFDEDDGE